MLIDFSQSIEFKVIPCANRVCKKDQRIVLNWENNPHFINQLSKFYFDRLKTRQDFPAISLFCHQTSSQWTESNGTRSRLYISFNKSCFASSHIEFPLMKGPPTAYARVKDRSSLKWLRIFFHLLVWSNNNR